MILMKIVTKTNLRMHHAMLLFRSWWTN